MKGALNETLFIFHFVQFSLIPVVSQSNFAFLTEIKARMEMDVDEVGKFALKVKKDLEVLDRDVGYLHS